MPAAGMGGSTEANEDRDHFRPDFADFENTFGVVVNGT
jgi:hypothetical protein